MKTTAAAICKAIDTLDVAEERAAQLVTRVIKATNCPELFREVAKVTLKLDDIRNDELADEMVELVCNLRNDDDMRALLASVVRKLYGADYDYKKFENAISEVAQVVAVLMVGTKVAANC
jgi:hypothetical protein